MKFRHVLTFTLFFYGFLGYAQETFTSPYKFIENKGQWHSGVKYKVDVPSGSIFMLRDRIVYDLIDRSAIHDLKSGYKIEKVSKNTLLASAAPTANYAGGSTLIDAHTFTAKFINANPNVSIYSSFRTPEYYNYMIGGDKSKWAGHVRAYYVVNYEDLYSDINVSYYATRMGLKYDFLIKPGGCLEDIVLDYSGVEVQLDEKGNLEMLTSLGKVIEQSPIAYQMVEGQRVEIPVNFVLDGFELSIEAPEGYHQDYPLVVDPLLIFSTYSGSPADNWGNTATFDDGGSLYSGGITNHNRGAFFLGEFPATEGAYQTEYGGIWDVAILKYDSAGSDVIYATYLGGGNSETPHSTIVNENNELIIFGTTGSLDFPVTNDAYQTQFGGGTEANVTIGYNRGTDFFISKLSADGSQLLSSTYLGGALNDGINPSDQPLTRNYGDQLRGDVNVDNDGKIYVTSSTSSPDLFAGLDSSKVFRHYGGGVTDGMVAKFTQDLKFIEWAGFVGGDSVDGSYTVKFDQFKNVFIAGGTASADFPIVDGFDVDYNGGVDGWIMTIQADGSSIVRSTYVGTPEYDQIYFLDLDSDENVFAFGQTKGFGFPVTPNTYSNPNSGQFLQKYNKLLDQRLMSTTFGDGFPEPDISPTAFLVNECNNIYVAGWGSNAAIFRSQPYYNLLNTEGLPVTASEAEQATTNGSDFYLAVFSDDAERFLHGTYFGGGEAVVHVDGGTSRFDKAGIVYHAVCADCGFGDPSTFTTTEGAWSRENLAVNDDITGCNNASFKFDLASLRAGIQTNTVDLMNPGIKEGCYPFELVFENLSVGGETYDWDFGDGRTVTVSSRDTIRHLYEEPGTYRISLRAFDQNTCVEEAFASTNFTVYDYSFDVGSGGTICEGDDFQLTSSGGVNYQWTPDQGLSSNTAANPVASPVDTTLYTVKIIDSNSCEYIDSVQVNVVPLVSGTFEVSKKYDCNSLPTFELSFTGSGETISWDLGNGETSEDSTFMFKYSEAGDYRIELTAEREFCVDREFIDVTIEELIIPNVFTPNDDGVNDRFEINSVEPVNLTIVDRWGKVQFEQENYTNQWDGGELASGVYYYELVFPDLSNCTGWVQIMR